MNPAGLLVWYIIAFAGTIATLILQIFFQENGWKSLLRFIEVILIGGVVYFGWMMVLGIMASTDSSKGETLLGGKNKSFMLDQWFKFLFSLAAGAILLQSIYIIIYDATKTPSGFVNWYVYVFINYIFPIFCIIEIFITPRGRSPNALVDLIILLIIICVLVLIEGLVIFNYGVRTTIAEVYSRCIFCFDGYILYDFLVFKRNGGSGAFTLFYS